MLAIILLLQVINLIGVFSGVYLLLGNTDKILLYIGRMRFQDKNNTTGT